jgi:hypothetical protein
MIAVCTNFICRHMYENPPLTGKQIHLLLDFLQGLVLRNTRDKFAIYLFGNLKTEG